MKTVDTLMEEIQRLSGNLTEVANPYDRIEGALKKSLTAFQGLEDSLHLVAMAMKKAGEDDHAFAIQKRIDQLASLEADLHDWLDGLKEPEAVAGNTRAPGNGKADVAFVDEFLNMKAYGRHMNLETWAATMVAALNKLHSSVDDHSYNEFEVNNVYKILKPFASKIEIAPAREYSVAMYIKADEGTLQKILKLQKKLKADEAAIDEESGDLRLWWD
jgi:hypothetical protein